MKFDIKMVGHWDAPDCDGAPILTMSNIPLPMHGQCVPSDAKVLTPIGWVEIKDITEEDVVLCWSNGLSFFDKVQAATKTFITEGYKIGYQKKHNFDMLYSPHHRLPIELVTYSWGKHGRYKYDTPHTQTKTYTAEEFTPKTNKRFYTSSRGTGEDNVLSETERVYIAIQADGSLHRTHPTTGLNEYRIKVVKERKATRLRELLPKVSLKWAEIKSSDNHYEFAVWTPLEAKTFSNVFKYSMGYNKARAFIEELCLWDGHKSIHDVFGHEVKRQYYCSSRYDNIEFVQAVAAQSGYTTNTIKDSRALNKPQQKDLWTIWFEDKPFRSSGYMKKEKIQYNDYMYCITVPSSFFLMKWQDKVVITGNCPRTINPKKWEYLRKKCYMDANYTCQASGRYLGHGHLHAHELYSINWADHTMTFKRAVALDPVLHTRFIHSGRALTLFKKHDPQMTQPGLVRALQQGFSLIHDWNVEHSGEEPLRVYAGILEWAKHPDLKEPVEKLAEAYNIKFYDFDWVCFNKDNWSKWRLIYDGKEYPTKYKTQADWEATFNPKSPKSKVEDVVPQAFAELDEMIREV